MRRQGRLVAVALMILAIGAVAPGSVAEGSSASVVRLAVSGDDGVTFEVRVPWEQLTAELVEVDGKAYARVMLPGWASTTQAGAPALPMLVQSIGVPFGAQVSVSAEPGEAHTLVLPGPALPVVTQYAEWGLPETPGSSVPDPVLHSVVLPDAAVYDDIGAYPGVLVEVGGDSIVRQQRVVGILAYPAQYEPSRQELTVYESIKVHVRFERAASEPKALTPAVDESQAYEEILQQSLLNYESARGWRAEVSTSLGPADVGPTALPWAPPQPGWRITVREDGIYRLTYDELQVAGALQGNPDPRTLKIYYQGEEIAIQVIGEADGQFDPSDYVLFYGQGLSSKYTRDNAYWLGYGPGNGLRMATRDGTPGAQAVPAYYPAMLHLEENTEYYSNAPGGVDVERWFWGPCLYPPQLPDKVVDFALPSPYTGDYSGRLVAKMVGVTDYILYDPDHHVKVSLNGRAEPVADVKWDGRNWITVDVPIAQSLLQTGANTFALHDLGDLGTDMDAVYVDWIELKYANRFVAQGDELAFGYEVAGDWRYQVEGYTGNEVLVYDVTDPADVVRMEGVAVSGFAGVYTASFRDNVQKPKRYCALTPSAFKAVQGIQRDTASNLASSGRGADHIIITHATFIEPAMALRNYRATQQLRTVVVDVQDVYDEFGYGVTGPEAIRGFLAYAYANWERPAPSYVVLIGDGHYDPNDYLHIGRTSFIPPFLAPVDPWIVETASDNQYVTLVGNDTVPDMMIGRLAVNSVAEASAYVDKIIAYNLTPASGAWRYQWLAVADNADVAGPFHLLSDDLISVVKPDNVSVEKVYLGFDPHQTTAKARSAIQSAINSGKFIVNYIGHGSTNAWANELLLTTGDVAGLANGSMLPLVLTMDCLNGRFHYPQTDISTQALAEVITRAAGKGAIASWSPSGMGVAAGHRYLNRGFLLALRDDEDGVLTIGQATLAGKMNLANACYSLDLLDTYHLFGDPATLLNTGSDPTAVEVLSFTARGLGDAVALRWETSNEAGALGYNLYRARWPGGPKTLVNPEMIACQGAPGGMEGGVYRYRDERLRHRSKYYYWLETVGLDGGTTLSETIGVTTK